MKILLSAYACAPQMGSDPGIGWQWAVHLAQAGHDVTALTRNANRTAIETFLATHPMASVDAGRLRFAYYDLPRWASFWKKGYRGIHLYYFLWQVGAFWRARALHRAEQFDCAHHATFVSARQPSFMGLLGIPFIFGPVGGGETSPWQLREGFPSKGWAWELMRDLSNRWAQVDPLMRLTFASAERIWAGTGETLRLIPARYHPKTALMPLAALTASEAAGVPASAPIEATCDARPFRLLCVSRLWYWKGVHLALEAVAQLALRGVPCHFTIVGEGPQAAWLRGRSRALGLDHHPHAQIEWIPRLPREELLCRYADYDAFVFPSLHDSGGFVALEAMAAGLPVLCWNLGGPGVMVNNACGRRIDVNRLSKRQAVSRLVEALAELAASPDLRATLAEGARRCAAQFQWSALVAQAYPLTQDCPQPVIGAQKRA